MKYAAVFFDWGDTLAPLDGKGVPVANEWINDMIPKLYNNCYRLGIISNTHRYQDAHWIRRELERRSLLAYFEFVISSATYAMHKPDAEIFAKAYEFMQIDPRKVVMVGDSEHSDGGCQYFGSTYLKVKPREKWDTKLYELLGESFPSGRALTNLYEFNVVGGVVHTLLRHLSESLLVGSRIMMKDKEYTVTQVERPLTKEEILAAGHEWYKFKAVPV